MLLVLCLASALANGADETPRKEAPDDPTLARELESVDARAGRIRDFSARFRQEKFTALLKKPLVSSGTVRVSGSTIRWDTREPEPAVLFSDGKDVRMYYPDQQLVEIYPIDRRMGDLAASPLPKLATLREHFTLTRGKPEWFKGAKGRKSLALQLVPVEDVIREHVEEVRVLIDIEAAHILELEVIDADGDRTHITFDDVRLDTGIKPADLALAIPEGTTVSRPLEATDGAGAADDQAK